MIDPFFSPLGCHPLNFENIKLVILVYALVKSFRVIWWNSENVYLKPKVTNTNQRICLDLCREYVTRLSDTIPHRFGRKMANNL